MAKNQVYNQGDQFSAVCSQPANPVSGDAALVGQLPVLALTAKDPVTGENTVKANGVYNLAVLGHDGTNPVAVAVGDIVYYTAADPTKLGKKATGVRYGYALAAVAAGATATIPVKIGY